jgi:hypothetical protein
VATSLEISAARDEAQHTREQLSDTIDELENMLTAPVRAVKRRLEMPRLVQEHPWAALAVAVGVGALVASTGAEKRAAELTLAKAKEGGAAGLRLAGGLPGRTRSVLGAAVDAIGAKVAITLIESLREAR